MFKGYAAGALYNNGGSGSNFLCLPEDPQWKTYLDGDQSHTASLEWNMNYFIVPTLATTTYSPRSTMAVIRFLIIQRRVPSATCKVDQQLPWFQQEHSVRTAGRSSTQDIWCPNCLRTVDTAVATPAGTRHRKLQLAEQQRTLQWSTLLKSSVDHCHAQSTSQEES